LTDVRLETFAKKLIGRNDIEDALKRLDRLTQEEARMAIAVNLKVSLSIEDKVEQLIDGAQKTLSVLKIVLLKIYTTRWQGGKRNHSTSGKRNRRSEAFVTSYSHCC
jgi:hypothetical protein